LKNVRRCSAFEHTIEKPHLIIKQWDKSFGQLCISAIHQQKVFYDEKLVVLGSKKSATLLE
jgi:hypothetical protein